MNAALDGGLAAADAAKLKVGVWIDCPLTQVDEAYAQRLRDLGITEGAIMVNQSNTRASDEPWRLLAPETTIVRAARALRGAGIEVVLTCWPRPAGAQLAMLHEDMKTLMRETKANAIEVDVEANWHPRYLEKRAYADMKVASKALATVLRDCAAGARVELNTFPLHHENSAGAYLAPLCDVLVPQAYSVCERDGKKIPWDHEYGPGRMQRLAMSRARETGCPSITLGLAAYEQRFEGHTHEEAMAEAVRAARELGVTRVRYWSSKWIVGRRGQSWARQAVEAASR